MTKQLSTAILLLLIGFFEGSGFYSFLGKLPLLSIAIVPLSAYSRQFCQGMMAYYTKNITDFVHASAMATIHWFLMLYALGVMLVPLVYATKLGLYVTILLISALGCLVSPLFLLHYHFLIRRHNNSVIFVHQSIIYFFCVTLYGLICGSKTGCILGIVRHGIPDLHEDENAKIKAFLPFCYTLVHYVGMFAGYFPFVLQLDQYYEMNFYKLFSVMIISNFAGLVVLRIGRKKLHFNQIRSSVVLDFMKLSYFVLKTKLTRNAEKKMKIYQYTPNDVAKLKVTYRMLILYIPVIAVIALIGQKYSRFAFQSEVMKNEISRIVVHPTLIVAISPLVIAVSLPIFTYITGPLARKLGRTVGQTSRSILIFLFVVLAFAAAVIIECKVEYYRKPYIKVNEGYVQMYNTANCPASMNVSGYTSTVIVSPFNFSVIILEHLTEKSEREVTMEITCSVNTYSLSHAVTFYPDELVSYAIVMNLFAQVKEQTAIEPRIVKLSQVHAYLCSVSSPNVRIVYDTAYDTEVEFRSVNYNKNYTFKLKPSEFDIPTFCLIQDEYTIWINRILMRHELLGAAGQFTLLISYYDKSKLPSSKILVVVPSNEFSILYQVPQFMLADVAEMIIRSPGFIYAGSKIPPDWSDLLFTFWYASEALGNLVVTITALVSGINRQLFAFLLWYGVGLLSLIGVSELLLKYYKIDYDELAEKRGIIK